MHVEAWKTQSQKREHDVGESGGDPASVKRSVFTSQITFTEYIYYLLYIVIYIQKKVFLKWTNKEQYNIKSAMI